MKKVVLSLCMVICAAASASPAWAQGGLDQRVSELSQQIANKMTAKQKTTIAIVEFTDLQGNVTDFGRYVAEELVTRLYETDKFKVIERQLLNKVIAEQKLSLTGVIDPSSAKRLGRVLGVDAIVSGTITNLAQSLKLNARLISTETGEIFAVASTEIFKDESVTLLMNAGTKTATAVGGSASPPAGPGKNAPMRIVSQDFIVELNSCKLLNGILSCQFTVTNDTTEDRGLTLLAESRIFDDLGNDYTASEWQIGREKSRIYGAVRTLLVPHILTKAVLKFENINQEATRITLLRIAFNDPRFNVDFRNPALTK